MRGGSSVCACVGVDVGEDADLALEDPLRTDARSLSSKLVELTEMFLYCARRRVCDSVDACVCTGVGVGEEGGGDEVARGEERCGWYGTLLTLAFVVLMWWRCGMLNIERCLEGVWGHDIVSACICAVVV